MSIAPGVSRPVRVLLVEDNELFRLAFSLVVEELPEIEQRIAAGVRVFPPNRARRLPADRSSRGR